MNEHLIADVSTIVALKCGGKQDAKMYNKEGEHMVCSYHGLQEIVPTPDLQGRVAKCEECTRVTNSDIRLAFFHYKPEKEKDSYYCGCSGWD